MAILEFNVEFLVEMPDSDYIWLTDEMYKIFVESIKNNTGWQVVSKEEVAKSPKYKDLKKKQYQKGVIHLKKKKAQNTLMTNIYPTSQLGILSLNRGIKRISPSRFRNVNSLKEAGVLEDTGAEAVLKVHTIVSYYRRGKISYVSIVPYVKGLLSETKIDILIGYTKTPSRGRSGGYTDSDGKSYIYEYKNNCSFSLDDPIYSYERFSTKQGTFDLEDFVYWIQEMFSIYADMVTLSISNNL